MTAFLPNTRAPGVIWVKADGATPMSMAEAATHRALLIRLASDSDRDALDAADEGRADIAEFHRGMAAGFRQWAIEISAALAAQARPVQIKEAA